MKDREIFDLMKEHTGINPEKVLDYRPCSSSLYNGVMIPKISDAITMQLKTGGTLIYIPERDKDGNMIRR